MQNYDLNLVSPLPSKKIELTGGEGETGSSLILPSWMPSLLLPLQLRRRRGRVLGGLKGHSKLEREIYGGNVVSSVVGLSLGGDAKAPPKKSQPMFNYIK